MNKKGSFARLSKPLREAIKKKALEDTPLLLRPFAWGARKVMDPKKVDDLIWNIQSPFIRGDMAAGEAAQRTLNRVTGGQGRLFKDRAVFNTSGVRGASTGGREFDLHYLSAPAAKAGKIVMPILGTFKAEELLRKAGDNMSDKTITKADLEKTAQMIESLHGQNKTFEKRAKATELLYKQAELGLGSFPKNYGEYQEKVAELMDEDLKVVEEAMKLASSKDDTNSFGSLNKGQMKTANAHESFKKFLLED